MKQEVEILGVVVVARRVNSVHHKFASNPVIWLLLALTSLSVLSLLWVALQQSRQLEWVYETL